MTRANTVLLLVPALWVPVACADSSASHGDPASAAPSDTSAGAEAEPAAPAGTDEPSPPPSDDDDDVDDGPEPSSNPVPGVVHTVGPPAGGAGGGSIPGDPGSAAASENGGASGDDDVPMDPAGSIAGQSGSAAGGAPTLGGSNSGGVSGSGGAGSPSSWTPDFTTVTLSTEFVSEGSAVADIDDDGVLDLVAGPLWYRGPDFAFGGEISDAPVYSPEEYSLFFLTFAHDLDGDTLPDVIAIGDAGGGNGTGNPNAKWYQNPGPDALDQHWPEFPVYDGLVANESPAFLDLVGDAQPELVFMTDQQLGYAAPGADPTAPWEFQAISGAEFNTPYVHGLGVGDVDGNGLNDVVEASGYWLQQSDGSFDRREVNFTEGATSNNRGGAQMLVFDVDGDGDSDVVTSLSGHGYGLSWFEQTADGAFSPHVILEASATGESFSQLHALQSGDLNGDGLTDFVTGKRYYAHRPPTDPGGTDPPVIYWFELRREGDGAGFIPHPIHDDSGVGCNFTIADLDGNGRADIFVSNKKGDYVHLQ